MVLNTSIELFLALPSVGRSREASIDCFLARSSAATSPLLVLDLSSSIVCDLVPPVRDGSDACRICWTSSGTGALTLPRLEASLACSLLKLFELGPAVSCEAFDELAAAIPDIVGNGGNGMSRGGGAGGGGGLLNLLFPDPLEATVDPVPDRLIGVPSLVNA